MTSHAMRTVVGIFIIGAVAACTTTIYRVNSSKYGWGTREDLTAADVRGTIERTAITNGWSLSDTRLGSFVAKKEWGGGKHNIVVDVSYSGKDFSIDYKDSKLMSYDGSSIHHTYNRFVKELEAAIQANVAKL